MKYFPLRVGIALVALVTAVIAHTAPQTVVAQTEFDRRTAPAETLTAQAESGLDAFRAELAIYEQIARQERGVTDAFTDYFGLPQTPIKTLSETLSSLRRIEKATESKPALVYSIFVPSSSGEETVSRAKSFRAQDSRDDDELELVLLTSEGKVIRQRLEGVTRSQIRQITEQLVGDATNIRDPSGYLESSQQLYQWLIAPLEETIRDRQVTNLTFLMDESLRSVPLAALHDGRGFLAERYSLGITPSLALTDTSYLDVQNAQVLAMGAEVFPDQKPLPAVPVELDAIVERLWSGESFLNENFTVENLKQARRSQLYRIVHFATHAEFRPGEPSNSYIQLWDRKLGLDELRQLNLSDPPVDLLVLSACRTAIGNEEAELGFSGLAVQAGVKSVLGSLWYVSDEGTLGLMTTFYKKLREVSTKSEALRQAQLAMLRGEVRIEDGQLVVEEERFPLPPELAQLEDKELSHPYYWSAFTLIGNPW